MAFRDEISLVWAGMTVNDTIYWSTGKVGGRIEPYLWYSAIFISQHNWGLYGNLDNSNRLEGANGPTGGWSRHVIVYWSTDCQKSMLCSVFGWTVCRKEALVERMHSFVTQQSRLQGQR